MNSFIENLTNYILKIIPFCIVIFIGLTFLKIDIFGMFNKKIYMSRTGTETNEISEIGRAHV